MALSEEVEAKLKELADEWDRRDREGCGSDAIWGVCAEEMRDVIAGKPMRDDL